MQDTEYDNIWREHLDRRSRRDARFSGYDPLTGTACHGTRVTEDPAPYNGDVTCHIPESMSRDPEYAAVATSASPRAAYVAVRSRHDFEFWAATCVNIKDKMTGAYRPFILNVPQRRLLAVLEADRLAGRPIRVILLKARQWGGSTLIQMYMAWIQCCLRRNHNSLICAHVKDTAANIRGMYTQMLAMYPREYWHEEEAPAFRPFERTLNVREIAGRGCRVVLGSAENYDAVRGNDFAMAHLSEVAFWGDSTRRRPDDLIRAVCGSVARAPLTLVAMESTANGVGNYFHREWLRSVAGDSDKHPLFIPWYDIEIYRTPLSRDDLDTLWPALTSYERGLWARGLDLEMIRWYHDKRREYADDAQMFAEYPSDADEAFANTGRSVFDRAAVEALRPGCRPPLLVGEAVGEATRGPGAMRRIRLVTDTCGCLRVWERPAPRRRYVTAVDIGGRSARSDYSVIAVLDVTPGDMPRVAAQWRGHTDHDILAWKAATVGALYNHALLVFESNTLESEATDGDPGTYILEKIAEYYPALYYRASCADGISTRPGFHTNRATKTAIISELIAAVRDGTYIERDTAALDEYTTYEQLPDGTCAARRGCHDDILITRAIALYVSATTR